MTQKEKAMLEEILKVQKEALNHSVDLKGQVSGIYKQLEKLNGKVAKHEDRHHAHDIRFSQIAQDAKWRQRILNIVLLMFGTGLGTIILKKFGLL